MNENETKPPPVVFISYSHDTKDHKAWVADLGARLRANGIEVVLDQWDTKLGDDLPKFMERGVKHADRVLMVCTEPYVRKVDDGKGGAGYEAMIVTSELVRDQGVNKFIPVIRQTGKDRVMPNCLGARKYVDLSADKDFDEGLRELLETIHKVVAMHKPPLGPNPFAQKEPTVKKQREQAALARQFAAELNEPLTAYQTARTLIASRDLAGWRRLVQSIANGCAERLVAWKAKRQTERPTLSEREPQPLWIYLAEGVGCYDPLLACLCAAAESGDPDFSGQLGWIDMVLEPKGWERSGSTFWTDFPRTVLFALHTRLGSMLLQSGAGEQTLRLATTPIRDSYNSRESVPIYLAHDVMGYQVVFDTQSRLGWGFLNHLIEQTKWLHSLFGTGEAQRIALVAYFMLASFLEYCREATRKDRPFEPEKWHLDTPQNFCRAPEDDLRKAYSLILEQRTLLKQILEKNGLSRAELRDTWPKWMAAVVIWSVKVYQHMPRGELPQTRLPQDLFHDPYKL